MFESINDTKIPNELLKLFHYSLKCHGNSSLIEWCALYFLTLFCSSWWNNEVNSQSQKGKRMEEGEIRRLY